MSQEKNHVQLNIKNKNKKLRRKIKQLSHPQPRNFKKKIKKKEKKKKEEARKHQKKKKLNELPMCKCAHGHFHLLNSSFSPFSFLPILERKPFYGQKILRSHYLFSFFPTQLNTFQKSFYFHFLSKVFHSPYFTSKQTHPNFPILALGSMTVK